MRSLAVVLAAIVASPALAQTPPPPANPPASNPPPAYAPRRSTLYLAITGGALFPNDATVSRSGTIGGVPTSGSATAKFKDTYIASGILGLQLAPFLSFEIEGGYTHLKIKSGTGSLTFAGGTMTAAGVSGSGNALLGFGNLLIWPLGADALLAPYLGGGGGVAAFEGSALVGNASVRDISISTGGRMPAPAAAAIAGIDFGGPGIFRIGARYKYMWLGINNSHNFREVQAQAVTAVLSARC